MIILIFRENRSIIYSDLLLLFSLGFCNFSYYFCHYKDECLILVNFLVNRDDDLVDLDLIFKFMYFTGFLVIFPWNRIVIFIRSHVYFLINNLCNTVDLGQREY